MTMFQSLRNLDVDRVDLDDAVALLTFGKGMLQTYAEYSLEPPDWLTENTAALRKEVQTRRRDNLEHALKQARQREAALKTADEKRADVRSDIARLEKALAES